MEPKLGQIVLYSLTTVDADIIARRRDAVGKMHHLGAPVFAGQVFPMVIVKVNTPTQHDGVWSGPQSVNGQVLLDGDDSYWATLRTQVPFTDTDDQKMGFWFAPPVV